MAEELLVNIVGDASKLRSELNKAGGNVNSFAAKAAAAGKGLTIAGAAITAAFALTVRSAMSFQKQLAQVSTMLDKSAMKIMPQYKKGLQDMSMAFGESTDTLSRGLYDILSASIPPAKALGVLEISAKAAAAGITDTGVAADAITTILNSYGMSADQAGTVSDKLFAIVKRGKTTFAELAPSIGKVAATASMSGLSFDDLGASIATITRAGIRSEEAMTAINGVLRSFLGPTDEAKIAAKEFGLEMSTTTLKTEGLAGVMDKLRNATAEQLATIFPNIRGLKGMAAALGDAEGYAEDYALMLNSAGLTQEAFAKQSATLSFKLEQAKKSINVIAITIGDILMPAVEKIIAYVVALTGKIRDWIEAHKPLVEWIVETGAVLGALAAVGGPILMTVSALVKLKAATAALGTVSAGPIGVFIIAIAGVVTGLKKWQEQSRKTKEEQIRLKANLLTREDILKIVEALYKRIAFLKSQIALFGESVILAGDVMKEELEVLEAELEVWIESLEATGRGIKQVDEFATAFADKMLKLSVATKGVVEATEDIPPELEEVLKGSALLSAQMSLLKTEYENSNKTLKDTQEYYESMEELLEEYIKQLKIEIEKEKESTPTWFAKNEELLKAEGLYKKVKEAIEELNKVQDFQLTGLELVRAKMELLELRYKEIEKDVGYYKEKLELLREEHELLAKNLDEVIEKYGEGSKEYYIALAAIEANENAMKRWWKEIDKGGKTIDEFAQSFADKMLMMKVAVEGFKPPDIDPWKEFFDGIKKKYSDTTGAMISSMSNVMSAIESALSTAFYDMLSGAKTFEESMKDLWKGIVDAVIKELARLAAFYVVKWLFGVPTLETGGIVKGFDFGGEVKKYQFGGAVDTVPARLTVGEYVVDKPMTDFIKRFKAVPANLIEAISAGMPTPTPVAFATGGPVGTPNIAMAGFGETRINIDIHDNRIANDIDIKRMAITISDEVLRKIELKRRH